jgi:ribosome-associated protein
LKQPRKATSKKTAKKKGRKAVKTSKPAPRPARRAKSARASRATARKVAAFALEKKAADVVLMDLRRITDMTSFFIVCTGASTPQVKAIADHVIDACRKAKLDIYQVEGYDSLRWVLIDLIDIVVHIFQPEVRSYYQLERLWGDAPAERLDESAAEALS